MAKHFILPEVPIGMMHDAVQGETLISITSTVLISLAVAVQLVSAYVTCLNDRK